MDQESSYNLAGPSQGCREFAELSLGSGFLSVALEATRSAQRSSVPCCMGLPTWPLASSLQAKERVFSQDEGHSPVLLQPLLKQKPRNSQASKLGVPFHALVCEEKYS